MKKIKVQEIFITCYLLYKQKRETRKIHIYFSTQKKYKKGKSETNEVGYLGDGGKGLERALNAGRVGSRMEEGHFSKDDFL